MTGLEGDDGSVRERREVRLRPVPGRAAAPGRRAGVDRRKRGLHGRGEGLRAHGCRLRSAVPVRGLLLRQRRQDVRHAGPGVPPRYRPLPVDGSLRGRAAGDLNLQADPITQNRWAFAGGNPVNNGSSSTATSRRRPTTGAPAEDGRQRRRVFPGLRSVCVGELTRPRGAGLVLPARPPAAQDHGVRARQHRGRRVPVLSSASARAARSATAAEPRTSTTSS